MSDEWFAGLLPLSSLLGQPVSSDPDVAALLTPVDPGTWVGADVDISETSEPGVRVRVYRPRTEPEGWFVWLHGGAWAFGDLDMPEADATAREVCARANRVVVSVDYRLCVNGVHHPAPLDDVVVAVRWAATQAAGPLPIGGASAGANLATGAALRLRDEGGPVPSQLLLMYPAVHPALPEPSAELASKVATLSPLARFDQELIYGPLVRNYLGGPEDLADGYAMPGVADLAGLPPTLIHNCEYDALRASGELFAEQLREVGVTVELSCSPDVPHGHLSSAWLPQASAAIDEMVSFLRGRPAR